MNQENVGKFISELRKDWKVNENVQTAGANYRSIISISENGDKVEKEIKITSLWM